jgi:hypothetical protein
MSDLLEAMARAINQTDMFSERTEAAKNALRALDAVGYAVVPKEMTEAMFQAGPLDPYLDQHVWSKILAAAPKVIPAAAPD